MSNNKMAASRCLLLLAVLCVSVLTVQAVCENKTLSSWNWRHYSLDVGATVKSLTVNVEHYDHVSYCKEDSGFGFSDSTVWVDNGCRAQFTLCTNKPDKPLLQAYAGNDGFDYDFKCIAPDTTNITAYQFLQGQTDRQTSSSEYLRLQPARIIRDDGIWTCVSYSEHVASDPSDPVEIGMNPEYAELSVNPQDETVTHGTPISMKCSTPSVGKATYTFKKNGDKQEENESGQYSFEATSAYSGEWTCEVVINHGIATSGSHELKVLGEL